MPDGPSGVPTIDEAQKRWVELWEKAEDVAMHFNGLIVGFRLKALGAVTIGIGLIGATLLTKDGAEPHRHQFMLAGLATLLLAVGWAAISIIDFGYYCRLPKGAVNELLRLEGQSGGIIKLSTEIEKVAKGKWFTDSAARLLFYFLPFVALVLVGCFILIRAPSS